MVVECEFDYSCWLLFGQSIDRDVGNKGEPSIVNESRFRIMNKSRFDKLRPTEASRILRECVHEFLTSLLLNFVRGEKRQTFRYVQFILLLVDQSEPKLGPDGVFSKAMQKDPVHVFLISRFTSPWADLEIPTQFRVMMI